MFPKRENQPSHPPSCSDYKYMFVFLKDPPCPVQVATELNHAAMYTIKSVAPEVGGRRKERRFSNLAAATGGGGGGAAAATAVVFF